MIRATTPPHYFQFPADKQFDKVLITYSQSGKIILEKTENDLIPSPDGGGWYYYTLSESETKLFKKGYCELQVRATFDDHAFATDIFVLDVREVLDDQNLLEEDDSDED